MKFRVGVVSVLLCLVFFGLPASEGGCHEKTTIALLSGPFGTGSYLISSAAAEIINKNHPWLRIDHSESPGFVYNRKVLARDPEARKKTIIGHGPVINWLGTEGLPPFEEKLPPVKLLANYNCGAYWLVTLNPEIKGPKEIIGKKIGLGRRTQINWAIEEAWAIRYGWGIGDKVEIQYVGTKQATAALLDGLVDLAVVGAYFNPITKEVSLSPQTIELMASGRTIYHIPFEENAIRKVNEKGMPIIPFTIPAKTFEGLEKNLPVIADTIAWCASNDLPEEIAYEFVVTLIKNADKFKEYGDVGKLLTKDQMDWGWDRDRIHKGAIKAYVDTGLMK